MSFKSQFSPTCLDLGFPNRQFTQIEIWMSFKSQVSPTCLDSGFPTVGLPKLTNFPRSFGFRIAEPLDYPKLTNFSPTVWMNFQTGSNYPIEIWQVSNPNFSPTIWMNFQTGSNYPIEILQVSNLNFSPTVWMNFQTGSNYLMAIWGIPKSQSPRPFEKFQTRSDLSIPRDSFEPRI